MSETNLIEDESDGFDSKFHNQSNNIINENPNDEVNEMINSNSSIAKNIIIFSLEMLVVLLIECFNDDIAFLFLRNKKTSIIEAFSSICVILDILKNALPLALTQGYSFLISKLFSNKCHKEINILTCKMLFILIIVGSIVGLSIATYFGPLISLGFYGKKTSSEFIYMMRWVSIGIPFSIIKIGFSKYLFSLNLGYIATISSLFSLLIQIGFSFLLVVHFEIIEFGIMMSINLGAFISFFTQFIYIFYISEYSDKLKEDFTFLFSLNEISKFLIYLIKMGGIVFISIFSFISISFLGLLLNDFDYSILNTLSLLLMLFFMFSDSLTAACNVMVNYCIGEKQILPIKRIFFISLLILTISTVTFTIIINFVFKGIISLYVDKSKFENSASKYKLQFMITMFIYSYQSIFSELASALRGEVFSTIIISVKYLMSIVVGITLVKVLNYSIYGILNGMIVGQIFFTLCFCYYFYLLFENDSLILKKRLINENDFDNSLQEILFLESNDKNNGNIQDDENFNLVE